MGNRWSRVGRLFNANDTAIRIGLLGMDNSGKTTIMHQLKLETDKVLCVRPTIGFNVEHVRYGKLLLHIWDVSGGKPGTRALWQHYNRDTRAIIFVVDAADTVRLVQATDELRWLSMLPELENAVFLIYANKQDLPNVLTAEEIVILLALNNLHQSWAVQECCALNGVGLFEGLEQLELMLVRSQSGDCSVHCVK